ncbi:MAG: glycoside hydrolase family 92 protein, partial [Brevundimonas sp.]
RRTLAEEGPGGFDAVRAAAETEWSGVLDRIGVEGGTPEQQAIFRTALYRLHTMPHDTTGENVWWASDQPHYEDFYCLWDTFRTVHPLLTLIEPQRQRDMVRSLIDTQIHTGWLPDCRIAGNTGPTQGGSNADVVLADAIVKDLGGFDKAAAMTAMLKNADVPSDDPMNHGRELRDYLALGYMSMSADRSASRTLEYAYNDYVIGLAAQHLGRRDVARRLLDRSRNWRNLWDETTRCIRPRYADGRWLENFDCDREYPDQTAPWWDHPYYEGSARQYTTYVPHDVGGLTQRMGGDAGLVTWLDAFFGEGHYTHHNEPDILASYLYIHAGRQDRTAERTRVIVDGQYRLDRAGIPGNDDAGTLSAWYVWAAVGLFPSAGQPFYYIGSPIFERSTLKLEGTKTFTVAAPGVSADNKYVQSATLNGRALDRAWLTHEEV